MKKRFIIGLIAFGLGGSVGLSFIMSLLVWSDSTVILHFDHYHERLAEMILFPLWSLSGLWATIYCLANLTDERNWLWFIIGRKK